jgi:hypothetical protein
MTPTLIINQWPKQWVSGYNPSGHFEKSVFTTHGPFRMTLFLEPSLGVWAHAWQGFDFSTAIF